MFESTCVNLPPSNDNTFSLMPAQLLSKKLAIHSYMLQCCPATILAGYSRNIVTGQSVVLGEDWWRNMIRKIKALVPPTGIPILRWES